MLDAVRRLCDDARTTYLAGLARPYRRGYFGWGEDGRCLACALTAAYLLHHPDADASPPTTWPLPANCLSVRAIHGWALQHYGLTDEELVLFQNGFDYDRPGSSALEKAGHAFAQELGLCPQ